MMGWMDMVANCMTNVVPNNPMMSCRLGSNRNVSPRDSAAACSRACERTVSWTLNKDKNPRKQQMPIIKNVCLYPVISARNPPTMGPSKVPLTCAVKNIPKAQPDRSSGASWATKGMTDAWKPLKAPWARRSAVSWYTF